MSSIPPVRPTILDVFVVVVRLEGKVEPALQQLADHETRLRRVEDGRWPLRSIAALCAIATVLVAFLGPLMGR